MAQALRYYTKVKRGGRIELPKTPLRPGTSLEVILIEVDGSFHDLLKSSETSTGFWDNPIDDETWNGA